MLVLLFIGLVLVVIGAIYAIRHARKPGEQFSNERKRFFVMTLIGSGLILVYGVYAGVSLLTT